MLTNVTATTPVFSVAAKIAIIKSVNTESIVLIVNVKKLLKPTEEVHKPDILLTMILFGQSIPSKPFLVNNDNITEKMVSFSYSSNLNFRSNFAHRKKNDFKFNLRRMSGSRECPGIAWNETVEAWTERWVNFLLLEIFFK
jgi:hypothetical protein